MTILSAHYVIVFVITLFRFTLCSYSFDVVNDQRQEVLTFSGKAQVLEDVADDINQFCQKNDFIEVCNEKSFMDQILMHANRHVESKRLIEDIGIREECHGTVVGPDAAVLAEMAKEILAMQSNSLMKKYVEIGSYLGCSTFIMANLTANNNVLIYAHDIWLENMTHLSSFSDPPPHVEDYFLKFYNGVIERKLESTIIPIRGNSNYTLNIHRDSSISLAFVDGDHSYEGCLWDLRRLWPKMTSDGLIYVHDYWTLASNDQVALCIKDFLDEISAQVSRVGTTTFARIQVSPL